MDIQKFAKKAGSVEPEARPIDPNLVLQLDTDFACYECAWLEKSINSNFKALLNRIDKERREVGAVHVNACITLSKTKSGRAEMATILPYQVDRSASNVEVKARVKELRHLLVAEKNTSTMTIIMDPLREADDVLADLQTQRRKTHGENSSVISSGDKDLWMVQGQHWKNGRIMHHIGYGETAYEDVGNVKPKLIGRGTSWFWHQLVMGDSVDKIPGLEKLANETMDELQPLKSGKARAAGGSIACGEAKAVMLLDGVRSDKEAARLVFQAYQDYYGYRHAHMKMFEQAYLLWMQRTNDPFDLCHWLNERDINIEPSDKQVEKLNQIKAQRVAQAQAQARVEDYH